MAIKTFKEAYGVLQRHAQTLRDQQEPNIDNLLTVVTESVDAYKVCKERIDAVEKALEKALSDTVAPKEKSAKGKPLPKAEAAVPEVDDGDIPF